MTDIDTPRFRLGFLTHVQGRDELAAVYRNAAELFVAAEDLITQFNRSSPLGDSEHRPAGGRERSSAAWSGGHPRRPVAVFRHRAVAAAKPSGNPPSLARVGRGGAQGVALTPRSVRSRRCHTCPSAHLRVVIT